MKKILYYLSACICINAFALTDNNVTTQQQINELNTQSNPNIVQEASDSIDDWAYSAIKKFGFDEFGEHDGKFFFFASETVSLKPTDPQFGSALVNAYDKALMKLQSKYLMARFGRISVEKLKEFYSDRSTNAKDIELPDPTFSGFLGKISTLIDKTLDVTGKKLDNELIKLGVSPEELKKMTPKMKKNIFKDKFLKTSVRQASGSIAGLFPIQTALAKDSSGTYVVGIIAIATHKTIQISKDIRLHRKSLVQGKGKDIKELLPTDEKQYLSTFGVRLAYDKDGSPMIISYGIGSYSKDGDSYIDGQLKAEAKENAISNADVQIAEILNGYMSEKQNRTNGEEIRKYVEREMTPNSQSIEKTINNIIKITNNNARSHANASIKGISTVKTWHQKTDEGVKFVGVVRVWKYRTLKAINDFNNGKYESKVQKKKTPVYKSSIQESAPVNDVQDF